LQPDRDAFRAACGASFDALPDIVRRAQTGTARLAGRVAVQRGSPFASLIADALGLPQAGASVDMMVESEHRADVMIWNRTIGGRPFRSRFRFVRDRLAESVRPFSLLLRLVVADGRLHYRLERVSAMGLPWPRALAPHLEAWEGAANGQYAFAVEVRLPILGRLVRYSGTLDIVS
jgi:hypothetical protein